MRSRGRGRSSWRTNAQSNSESATPVEAFPAPAVNNQVPPPMDFYQQNLPAPPEMEVAATEFEAAPVPVSDNSDASMQEGEQQGEKRNRPWDKPGIKVKRKKIPGAKNLKIRRYVQPKNAVMCLNELKPGVTYTMEQEGGVGQPFCVSVEVPGAIDGQKYRGFGSSKQLAKQAAAEAALISFVKPPVATATPETQEEDKTPWATLASFAIYKLFNDWREGRVGMCSPPAQPYGTALPPGMVQAFLNQTMGAPVTPKEESTTPQATMFTEAISAHLGGRAPNTPAADLKSTDIMVKIPNPAKAVPDNAASMHPVMVLHQMKPGLLYNVSQTTKEGKPFFSVTVDIDGKQFCGEGLNVKKAKFFLAKAALLAVYQLESTFEAPA